MYSNYSLNRIKLLSHKKNNKKYFELKIEEGILTNIQIFDDNGQLLNDTHLENGKVVSYKILTEENQTSKNQDITSNGSLSHQQDNKKVFDFKIVDGIITKIQIFYDNGELLSETQLENGKVVSYKKFREKNESSENQTDSSDENKNVPKLEYEICLNRNFLLKNYKIYDKHTDELRYEGKIENDTRPFIKRIMKARVKKQFTDQVHKNADLSES